MTEPKEETVYNAPFATDPLAVEEAYTDSINTAIKSQQKETKTMTLNSLSGGRCKGDTKSIEEMNHR